MDLQAPAIDQGVQKNSPVILSSDIYVGDGSVDLKGNPSIRARTGTWKASPFIYGILLGDTICVLGILGNILFYLVGNQHLTVPEAANVISYFMGTSYLVTLFWGFLADSYVGRFWILTVSAVITIGGMVILTLSTILPALQPPVKCVPSIQNGGVCPRASDYVLSWMYAGLYTIAVGSAGLKPTMTALGQDQFEQTHPAEKKTGEHFFTGYIVVVNLASVFNVSILFYIQSRYGYGWGYGLGAAILFIVTVFFFIGTPYYRHVKPSGSALTRLAQVVVVAIKHFRQPAPGPDEPLYELSDEHYKNKATRKLVRTDRLRFLDKAATLPTNLTTQSGPWELCTVTQVEELKSVVQLLPVWATTITIYIMFSQIVSFSGQQALTMQRQVGNLVIPPGSVVVFLLLGALIFVPIYEFLIVPVLRRFTGHPHGLTSLQRIGVGMFLAVFGLLSAALVEDKKVHVVLDHHISPLEILESQKPIIPMSCAWLIPQYAILGAVEFLVAVGMLQFFYTQCPDSMRTVATALFFSSVSVGYFLSTAVVDLVNKYSGGWLEIQIYLGGLRKYYWLLTATVAVNFVAFLLASHWYTYKKLEKEPGRTEEPDDL